MRVCLCVCILFTYVQLAVPVPKHLAVSSSVASWTAGISNMPHALQELFRLQLHGRLSRRSFFMTRN